MLEALRVLKTPRRILGTRERSSLGPCERRVVPRSRRGGGGRCTGGQAEGCARRSRTGDRGHGDGGGNGAVPRLARRSRGRAQPSADRAHPSHEDASQDRGHDAADKSQGPGKGVIFDVRTRKSFEIAAKPSEAKDGLFMGGGYSGAREAGGAGLEEALQPDSPSAPFTLLSGCHPGSRPLADEREGRLSLRRQLLRLLGYDARCPDGPDRRPLRARRRRRRTWADEVWVYPG